MKLLLNRQAIRIISISLLLFVAGSFIFSCRKENHSAAVTIRYLYSGEQREKGFLIRIVIYEDEERPAEVCTDISYDKEGFYYQADSETLSCKKTEDGFILSDMKTGKALYTAVGVEGNPPYFSKMKLSWNHSPGPVWDEYAEERGWEKEVIIEYIREDLDDIRY